jgi:hypothetical protein
VWYLTLQRPAIKTDRICAADRGVGTLIRRLRRGLRMTARPLDVLESALEEPVTVTLKDDRSFYGLLLGYDQHMNAVLQRLYAAIMWS